MPMPMPPKMKPSSNATNQVIEALDEVERNIPYVPSATNVAPTKQVIEALDEVESSIPHPQSTPADFSEDIARSASATYEQRKELLRESIGGQHSAEQINSRVMQKLSEAEFNIAPTKQVIEGLSETNARDENIFMQEMGNDAAPDRQTTGKPHP